MYRLHTSTILPIKPILIRSRALEKRSQSEKKSVSSKSGTCFACSMTSRWPSGSCLQGWGKGKGLGKTEGRWRSWGVWLGKSGLFKEVLEGWQKGYFVGERTVKFRMPGWKARHPLSEWGSNLPSLLQASLEHAAAWDRCAKETWKYLAGRKEMLPISSSHHGKVLMGLVYSEPRVHSTECTRS